MGTMLEGEWDDVMGVDCARIGMNLKVDYRAGPQSRLRGKIAKVEAHLGRKLVT